MILVCPECSARYLLSSAALGSQGRQVRCAKCNHEWYAEPAPIERDEEFPETQIDEDTLTDDLETDDSIEETIEVTQPDDLEYRASLTDKRSEDIPEGVKPLPKDKVPAKPEDVIRPQVSLQGQFAGFGAALFLFAIFIVTGLLFKGAIVTMWQPAAIIYEMAGLPVQFKGEGLVIESLSSDLLQKEGGQDVLVVKGRVVNLTKEKVDVPKMIAVLRSTNGENGDSWIIDPPVQTIGAGESFIFTTDYPTVPRGVGSVNLTFIPTVKGL